MKEFNDEVKFAIDSAFLDIVGEHVLAALYQHLKDHYDIPPDEVPYRIDTLFETLEKTFGVQGARTITKAIAKRFYYRMGLQFVDTSNYTLQDYFQQAKKELLLKPDSSPQKRE